MPGATCDVCGRSPVELCCSVAGAISIALCAECRAVGREPWPVMVGGMVGVSADTIAPEMIPFIEATCQYYGKTMEEFWYEVDHVGDDLFT